MLLHTNAYLATGGPGFLPSYRREEEGRSRARVKPNGCSDAAAKQLEAKQRRERQQKYYRMIRGDLRDDIAMDRKETQNERQKRLQEEKRINKFLEEEEERRWGIGPDGDSVHGLYGFLAELDQRAIDNAQSAIDNAPLLAAMEKKIREKERKRVHMMFKRCWAAFQKTDYGRILTDNPDLRKHLFDMLEESFAM